MNEIYPFRYCFPAEDIGDITAGLREMLQAHDFLTMGQYGEEFEAAFRQYSGTRHAIAVSSGTAALEIIFRALDVAGGEVIVPTNTYGATAVAVIRAGGIPRFADCTHDLTIDPRDVERRLTDRVRAVVTVHIGGLISPSTRHLQDLCRGRGVPLVEDAAHAAGSTLHGAKSGTFGVAAAFSFFSTKVITCGEGGMIATNDADIFNKAVLLRDHAKDEQGSMSEFGYNWRLPEIQSMMGLTQLKRLDEFTAKRNVVAAIYDEVLSDVPGISILNPPSECVHNRYKYVVFLERQQPAAVRAELWEKYRIPLGGFVYAVPCHLQTAFREWNQEEYPTAEELCSSHICPPIYQEMTRDEAYHVATSLRTVLGH